MTVFKNITLVRGDIEGICNVLGHTSNGFTRSSLVNLLENSRIEVLDDESRTNGYSYKIGLSKSKWLFNCFVNEVNKSQSSEKIFEFIQIALNPASFTMEHQRDKYTFLKEELNKVLLLKGLLINQSGKLVLTQRATTLTEVDRRVNELRTKLYNRAIHSEVIKYCIKDYLRKDYYDVVFEASKSLAQRVREITGDSKDGSKLFISVFNPKNPLIVVNNLTSESDWNEFNGLRELLEAITHLVRNPIAHTPKINWKTEEGYALDVLSVISFAHKYLDKCYPMPKYRGD